MWRNARRHLARLVYPYGSTRVVLRGPLRGLRYVVEPGMGATFALGYDADHAAWMARQVQPGMVAYDLGANRGQTALLLARLVGPRGRVVSFEPISDLCRSMRRNLALNGQHQVDVHCLAVGEARGSRAFSFSADHPTQGKLSGVELGYVVSEANVVHVECASLDELLAGGLPRPDFVKVDVEGSAGAVFRGAERLLREVGPPIYLELHGPEEQASVRDHLMAVGYRIERLSGEPVVDPVASWVSPLYCHK